MKTINQKQNAIALVVTLLVIVVLTIAVTAFMQSMSLERRTSQAYLNILKAETAVNTGLEKVKTILANKTNNDTFTIVKVEATPTSGPYYFIGTANDVTTGTTKTAANTTYTPLFSYLDSPSATPTATPAPAGDPYNKPAVPTIASTIAANLKPTLPTGSLPVNTSWETVQTGDPKFPKIRYSYWVEDLSGYLDMGVVGNVEGTGSIHVRSNGTDPKEISLFTVFNSTLDIDSGTTAAKELIANRNLLFTSQTIQQAAALASPSPTPDSVAQNLAAGLRYDTELETIPAGFGYADADKPKYNLNTLVATTGTGANVTAIAKVINDNLPLFNTPARKGSFGGAPSTQDYVKNLAANIVDYVDADNDPTQGPDYRGIDSYPFLTEHFIRVRWRNGPGSAQFYSSSGTWKVNVDVDLWIQLWNLSDQDITSGTFIWDDSGNEYAIYAGGGTETPLQPEPSGTAAKSITFSPSSQLRKNEYRVFNFPVVSYVCDTGISSSQPKPTVSAGGPKLSWKGYGPGVTHYSSNYSVTWNGKQIDRPGADATDGGGRIQRINGTLNSESTTPGENNGTGPSWRGASPGLRYNVTSETTFNLGDPRTAYNVGGYQAATDYDGNSSWYGSLYMYSVINPPSPGSNPWISAQTEPGSFPDGGHNPSVRGYSIYELQKGTSAANERYRGNRVPTDIPATSRPAYNDHAPTHVSNSGTYTSVLELGNIYDPAQWRPDWAPTGAGTAKPADRPTMLKTWNSLDTQPVIRDNPPSPQIPLSSFYGLCSTLRIGRGEFLTLDVDGTRGSQFLDLFTANANSQQSIRGKVNINTASRDALRALFAGIKLERDPNLEPPSLSGNLYEPNTNASTIVAADVFADTIIANRPYIGLQKLSTIRTSIDDPDSTASPKIKLPLFGNVKLWPASKQPTAWTDAAREEIFAKAFQLSTVRSRNFRVYVTGQVLNARGRVVAQSSKSFQLFVSPPRTNTGAVDTNKPMSVKNLYEVNL